MTNRVYLSQGAIKAFANSAWARRVLSELGSAVAEDARKGAPKDSGAGAASITYELGEDERGSFVHVGWGDEFFYMKFHELGTSSTPARPFLRPALKRKRGPRTI